jgi:hypothetical protein
MFEIDWQIVFSNLVLSYKLDIFWLECEKDENPQVHFRTPTKFQLHTPHAIAFGTIA